MILTVSNLLSITDQEGVREKCGKTELEYLNFLPLLVFYWPDHQITTMDPQRCRLDFVCRRFSSQVSEVVKEKKK